MVTTLLEKAFSEAAKLPRKEQEAFATWILKELADEQRWDKSFVKSEDMLEKMARKALSDHAAGKTQELDLTKL
jgi:hypothetical protein